MKTEALFAMIDRMANGEIDMTGQKMEEATWNLMCALSEVETELWAHYGQEFGSKVSNLIEEIELYDDGKEKDIREVKEKLAKLQELIREVRN